MENRKQGTDRPSVVQETPRQSVVITPELKVIVTTDNGVIENGTERVGLDGLFAIDATSVARLITALEGKTIKQIWGQGGELYITEATEVIKELEGNIQRVINDYDALRSKSYDEQKEMREEYAKKEKTMKEELSKCDFERLQYKADSKYLRKAIEDFNNARHFWERKIEIIEIK